jgi:NADPH-dependent 2,4-dienoyl-CoA reductase/sulfur reductase-like enzyme
MILKRVDLAVIGGGPGSLAAAIRAKELGMENILVLERTDSLGGLLPQCIHNGFGIHYFGEDLTGPEYADRFIERISSMDIEVALKTMVIDLHPDLRIVGVNAEWGEFNCIPRAVVLAMGCREKTRSHTGIPGSRPAGILTAGTAQKLVNIEGYMPGEEFVILGAGDLGMIMARRLKLEGAQVKAVVERMPYVGGLIRNEVQCLHDFKIPLFLEHTVTNVFGEGRIRGVEIASLHDGRVTGENETTVECDCLLLSAGLIPENELSRKAGVELDSCTGGPFVDEHMQTNVAGIFATGNCLQVYDSVDNVSLDGQRAGEGVFRYVTGELKDHRPALRIVPGHNVKSVTPQRIVGREDVQLRVRVKRPLENTEIVAGTYTERHRALHPSSMLTINLSQADVADAWRNGRLVVSCCEDRGANL